MREKERTYLTHEVAKHLLVGNSTLRRYCVELETSGYSFNKDEKNRRLFSITDMIALEQFKDLVKSRKVRAEEAASIIVKVNNPSKEKDKEIENQNEQLLTILKEILENQRKQEQINQYILREIESQKKVMLSYKDEKEEKRSLLQWLK